MNFVGLIVGGITLIGTAAILKQGSIINRNQERIMSQLDDLNTALDSVSTEIDKISTEVSALVAELQTINQNPAVDLSGAIAKAQAIEAKLTAVDGLFPPATPAS